MPRIVMVMILDFRYNPPAYNEGISLAEKGYLVDVLTLGNKGDAKEEKIVDNFIIHRLQLWTRFLPKTPVFWGLKYIEFFIRVVLWELSRTASVYEGHNFDSFIIAFFLAKIKGAKVLYRAHELYFEAFNLPFRSFWRWVESQLLRHVDATITPNEERSEIMYNEYGAKKRPYVVMNCPKYQTPIKSTMLQEHLKENGVIGGFIVLFQGNLTWYNGVEEMINAAKVFDDGISLVLIGTITPEYLQSLRSMVEELGLGKKVYIHPPVPYSDLPEYTASANVGIVLYRNINRNNYYCASNKLFEYFMMGLPVVSSNFPGLIKLVENSGCGITVEPTSPKEIADAVNKIYNDKEKEHWMKDNALKSAHIYNWENESKKLIAIYKNLLAGS